MYLLWIDDTYDGEFETIDELMESVREQVEDSGTVKIIIEWVSN